MKLLSYHENIDNYIATIYLYQVIIKPFNDKLTKLNLAERIKLTTLMLIYGTIMLIQNIFKLALSIKYKHENS